MSNKWNYDSFTISNAVYIFSFANLHNFEWNEKRGGKNSVEKNNNNFLLTTFCLLTTSSNNSNNIKLNKYKLQNVQNNCNAMCMIMLLLILPILLCSPFPSALTLPKHRSFSSFRFMQTCTNAAIHTALKPLAGPTRISANVRIHLQSTALDPTALHTAYMCWGS